MRVNIVFLGESAVVQKNFCRRYQYLHAAIKRCVKKLDFFLEEFGLQQQVTLRTHKSGGVLDQVITSEEVEVSEPVVNFVRSSDHGVVHFDLLQKHNNLAVKKVLPQKMA